MSTKKDKNLQFLEEVAGRPFTLNGLIESIRISDEISQKDFAKKLKISPSHLCDIEKGRKLVSPERAVKFAKILGYSERQFLRFSLQSIVDEAGLKFAVGVEEL